MEGGFHLSWMNPRCNYTFSSPIPVPIRIEYLPCKLSICFQGGSVRASRDFEVDASVHLYHVGRTAYNNFDFFPTPSSYITRWSQEGHAANTSMLRRRHLNCHLYCSSLPRQYRCTPAVELPTLSIRSSSYFKVHPVARCRDLSWRKLTTSSSIRPHGTTKCVLKIPRVPSWSGYIESEKSVFISISCKKSFLISSL